MTSLHLGQAAGLKEKPGKECFLIGFSHNVFPAKRGNLSRDAKHKNASGTVLLLPSWLTLKDMPGFQAHKCCWYLQDRISGVVHIVPTLTPSPWGCTSLQHM